jgi:hypothetical protein
VIPQHFPLYLREAGPTGADDRVWLVVGWMPDKISGLPRQPVALLCDGSVEEPRVLEQTTTFRVVGPSRYESARN